MHLFLFLNDTFVGATWGHCPHNFLAVGAIAAMESVLMLSSVRLTLGVIYLFIRFTLADW